MILVLPLAAAERDGDGLPQEILRSLSDHDHRGLGGFRELAADPEALLDVIFVPEGADAPDPGILELARELVPRLGDDAYPVRERADAELKELGTTVSGVLKEALDDPDPEIRHRCRRLLGELAGRKQLADLDYVNIQAGIERIIGEVEDPAVLLALAKGALKRMGDPTVHGREAFLLKPVFAGLAKRELGPSVIESALTGPSLDLAESVAAAVGEATSASRLNPAYFAALSVQRSRTLGILMARAPSLRNTDEDAIDRYRRLLVAIIANPTLPEGVKLKAHRLILVAFFDPASLRVLLDAARGSEAAVVALALSDPRLAGVSLEDSERASGLIDHTDPALREAAGLFLLTRPEEDQQQLGVDFVPHIGKGAIESLKLMFRGVPNAVKLRSALKRRVETKGEGWQVAERLLFALPPEPAPMPSFDIPFGFR